MRLWLLRPIDEENGPWRSLHDCNFGFVVRANSDTDARETAAGASCDEGRSAWLDPALSTCAVIRPQGKPGIVIRDFNAG